MMVYLSNQEVIALINSNVGFKYHADVFKDGYIGSIGDTHYYASKTT